MPGSPNKERIRPGGASESAVIRRGAFVLEGKIQRTRRAGEKYQEERERGERQELESGGVCGGVVVVRRSLSCLAWPGQPVRRKQVQPADATRKGASHLSPGSC